jgi:Flp pilus assembly protein TadG
MSTAPKTTFRGLLRRLRGDRSGVGAIEFAFIAPVMIVLYIGAVEVSVAMSVNKKLARASSTVADLITQEQSVTRDKLKSMNTVAQSIMSPYDPTPVVMKITGIWVGTDLVPKVEWSWKPNGGNGEAAYTVGSVVDIPENLKIANTFLLRSEIDYRHDMITSFPITGQTMTGIDMAKTYHLRPRIGERVTCSC